MNFSGGYGVSGNIFRRLVLLSSLASFFLVSLLISVSSSSSELDWSPESYLKSLDNLKTIFRDNLFINNDFFNDENIKKYFMVNKLEKSQITSLGGNMERIYLGNFLLAHGNKDYGDNEADGLRGFLDREVKKDKILCASVTLNFSNFNKKSPLTFESVEAVFGKNWKENKKQEDENWDAVTRESFNPAPQKRTHKMGYAVVGYSFDDGDIKKWIQFTFSYDGTLREAIGSEGVMCAAHNLARPLAVVEKLKPGDLGNKNLPPLTIEASPEITLKVEYPPMSRRLGEVGQVDLMLFIQSGGAVSEVKIINKSDYERLNGAAIEAARSWKFIPVSALEKQGDYWDFFRVKFQ